MDKTLRDYLDDTVDLSVTVIVQDSLNEERVTREYYGPGIELIRNKKYEKFLKSNVIHFEHTRDNELLFVIE